MKNEGKLLVVDDSPINRSLLIDILAVEFDVIEMENGLEAISYMEKHIDKIALVLLDLIMPVMDGFEVLTIMNKNGWIQNIPVITITSETASQSIDKAYNLGVCDYINRPFDDLIVQKRVKNTLLLYAKQKQLESMVTEQILEKEKSNMIMIDILSHIVEFRNGESGLHVLRIRIITEMIMKELACEEKYHFTSAYIYEVMNASALHDIGKIMISESILNKPGKLTKEEFGIVKTHSELGAQMLEDISYYKHGGLVQTAHDICRWHHERFDGSGYPDGLSGEQIPICAQVVALADVYDALSSKRVYKPAYSHEKSVEMILKGECGVFNPTLINCFKRINIQLKEKLKSYETKDSYVNLDIQNISENLLKGTSISNRTLSLLEQERTKYKFFASMSGEVQFEYNFSSNLLSFSELGAMILQLPEIIFSPMENSHLLNVISLNSLNRLYASLTTVSYNNPIVEILTQIKVNNEWRWFKILARPLWVEKEKPQISGIIGKCVDVHDEQMQMNALKQIAKQDSLTKLWNHKAARERIEWIIANKKDQKYALILVDLDYFKNANDNFGHMFGDEVLKYVANRLLVCVKDDNVVSRVGGDEFLIFVKYNDDIYKIVKLIHHTVSCNYKYYKISLSMGISLFPQNGNNYETIYQHADMALYTAKNHGREQYCFYDNIKSILI